MTGHTQQERPRRRRSLLAGTLLAEGGLESVGGLQSLVPLCGSQADSDELRKCPADETAGQIDSFLWCLWQLWSLASSFLARARVCVGAGGRHDWVPGRTGTEMPSRFISRSSALGSQERVDWEWLLCQPAKPKLPQRTGASFVAEEGPHFSHSPPPVHTGPVEV